MQSLVVYVLRCVVEITCGISILLYLVHLFLFAQPSDWYLMYPTILDREVGCPSFIRDCRHIQPDQPGYLTPQQREIAAQVLAAERNLQRIAERAAGEKDKDQDKDKQRRNDEHSGVENSGAKKRKKCLVEETEEERDTRRLDRKLMKRKARLLREAEMLVDGSEERDGEREEGRERDRKRGGGERGGREGREKKKMKKSRSNTLNHERNKNGDVIASSSSSSVTKRKKDIENSNEVEVINDFREGHVKYQPGDDMRINSAALIDTESDTDRSSDSDTDSYSSSEGFDDSEYEDTHDYDEPELRDDDEGIAFRNDDTEGIHKIFLMRDSKIRFTETGSNLLLPMFLY